MGGTIVAPFAYEVLPRLRGFVLWRAYPASGMDLSNSNLMITTIRGSNDGLVRVGKIADSLKPFPPSIYVSIAGGNHAQFGCKAVKQGTTQQR